MTLPPLPLNRWEAALEQSPQKLRVYNVSSPTLWALKRPVLSNSEGLLALAQAWPSGCGGRGRTILPCDPLFPSPSRGMDRDTALWIVGKG